MVEDEKVDEGIQTEAGETGKTDSETDTGLTEGEKEAGDTGEAGKEKGIDAIKGENETLTKRISDKDSHISTLERENATLRKSHRPEEKPTELSLRFPRQAEQIAQLRIEGKDLEADELSAQVRVQVYEEKIAVETSARENLVNDSQNRNNFREFTKYEAKVKEGLKGIPLDVLERNPDYWIGKEYNAAVGEDYLALKGKGKSAGKIEGGGGASSISGSPGAKGEKTVGEKISEGIAAAFPKGEI